MDAEDDLPEDVRRYLEGVMHQWWRGTHRRKRWFDRESNRRLCAVGDPEFWRSIAEMQRRLGWPAGGIKNRRDVLAWHEALYDNLAEAFPDDPFHIIQRPVNRALMREARQDGIKIVIVPEMTPDIEEGKRVCREWPFLAPSLDAMFVAEIARMGLLATLRQMDSILKGGEPMAPILPKKRYQFRGKLSKGRMPLDPDAAVRVFRLSQKMTLVEIGRRLGWRLYDNNEGGEHCPLAAHYRDRGREIIEAYDADSRPYMRVPSFDECISHRWFAVVP